ncbi:hypothetical protein C8R43DRAFT_1053710 [Mycena crocata]|nr:hypothetical protein C8R43DRAFT_1053710 [Mycena crocata]
MAGTYSAKIESSLQRRHACADCRRRKMRCDGRRPVCGPCVRASREYDCEYTDNQSRSRADMLEEDISRIESRIYELEHPQEVAGAFISLHHPYKQPQRLVQMPSMLQVLQPSRPVCAALNQFLTGPAPASSAADAWWNAPEPPPNIAKTLLDTFLPYASDWGFFLDIPRFQRDALLPLPLGHHSRPSPALLSAVYLVGIALSDSATLKTHENIFLSRVLSSLPASLSGLHPRKAIHAMQTEILLSNYFYASGRLLEGRYHTAAAASLAVGSVSLRAQLEEAEYLAAYRTTLALDKSWAVALAAYPNLQGSKQILDFIWPEEEEDQTPSSHLLEGTKPPTASVSQETLVTKAAVLWERANNLVVGWKPDMPSQAFEIFSSSFNTLDSRAHQLLGYIAAIDPAENSIGTDRAFFVGQCIAHAAVIQLHGTFAETRPESKQKCLAAAKYILSLISAADLRGSTFINPIIGIIWVAACEVVIVEIATLRAARPAWVHDVPTSQESALVGLFDRSVDAMRPFSVWPLMKYHIAKIEEAYGAM